MDLKGTQHLLLFFAFLCAQVIKLNGDSIPGCLPIERNALLGFKEGLKDPTDRLSSWVGDNCCTWKGVACNNQTGHVVRLDLRNPHPLYIDDVIYIDSLLPYNKWSLGGELRPSLLGLKYLNYLDLSMNYFGGIHIPEFMGSFRHLKYLNLSMAGLGGPIPHQLGNLSSLQYLDFYNYPDYYFKVPIREFSIDNALWISHLSSLRYLNMTGVKFREGAHWLQALNMLPSIIEVRLSDCQINTTSLSLPHVNFSSLSVLDLSDNFINSTLPSWLFNISSLEHLDLNDNNIWGTIPPTIKNLASLKFLKLSYNWFLDGKIPDEIGGLCKLQYLGLSGINISKNLYELDEMFTGCMKNSLETLYMWDSRLSGYLPDWLGDFRMLKSLDLGYNSLSGPLPASIGRLSTLEELDLSYNNIRVIIPSIIKNLASLKFLHLSGNRFLESKILAELGGLCKLQYLGLSQINISKNLYELDEVFTRCIKNTLETLYMRETQLSGYLPDWLGDFRMLKSLDLSDNSISGPLPASIGRLSTLEELYLSYNKLNDVMSKEQFANFTSKLKYLDLSQNQLILNLGPDWIPPFQLRELHIGSCKLGPRFPAWLRMQKNIINLDLSSTGISDSIPDWFWKSFFQINYLDISNNGFTGSVPDLTDFINLEYFNLSSNHFEGPLPNFNSSNMRQLDLSNNSFSGVIHPDIGKSMPKLYYLWLSTNSLSGEIPLSLCQLRYVDLDLSKNLLSGELPNCWKHYSSLVFVIDFSSNNLSGSVPPSICSLPFLESLHLSNNNLSGELPLSLKSCACLNTLDLGYNSFIGTIPTWIGESLLSLKMLRLRSNKFVGNIPHNLSKLSALQVLDLAHNKLSGAIPSSFGNFTTMKVPGKMKGTILNGTKYHENLQVTIKGIDIEYAILLSLVIVIDLSDNNLSGTIPEELTSLFGLMSLNLSGNHLIGEIPEKIGALQQLESLDLSRNKISGGIPSSMILLTFLSCLNLSYNNLSGRVPSDNQFQTFTDLSIYAGNPGLCGFLLTQKCKDDWTNQGPNAVGGDQQNDNAMDEEGSKMKWLNMNTGAGFTVGLWVIFGLLLFNKKWREDYFRLMDEVYDMVYMLLVVIFTRFIKIVFV